MSTMEDSTFYLWTSKTAPIKYLTELLRELLTEGNLECNQDGILLQAVNPTRVALVHTKLVAAKFEEYSCPKPIVLGLNMEDTFKVIKSMDNTDTLKLFVKKDNPNKLGIETYCKEENTINTTYLNLMDLPVSKMKIPPAQFDNVITMPASRFQNICRGIFNFSDKIEIECVGSQLIFKSHNSMIQQESRVKPTPNGLKFIQNDKPDEIIQGVFELKHLVSFSKCSSLSNTIHIHIKNDYPLILRCDIADIGEIKLCLAPQSDENN